MLMLKLNRGEIAKQCFMEALALDVKCYDAFEQLITGEMMTPEEGPFSLAYFITIPSLFCYWHRMAFHPEFALFLPTGRNGSRPGN
jgi:hypothetical protein